MNFSKLNIYSSNTQYKNKINNTNNTYDNEVLKNKNQKYQKFIQTKSIVDQKNNKELNVICNNLNTVGNNLNTMCNLDNTDYSGLKTNLTPSENTYNKEQFDIIIKILQLTKNIIVNVYQLKYNNNINASGIGDFIRGSYFLMQFCKKYNISYNIILSNHPISQFLDIYKNRKPLIYSNINKFDKTNHNPSILDNNIITNISDDSINNDFLYYLSKQKVFNKSIYTYIISYPTNVIDQEYKDIMKKIFKPTNELSLLVDIKLTNLKLVKYNYTIIHIRYGDNYLIESDQTINKNHFITILSELKKLDSSKTYLLISDNNIIKKKIIKYYPFIKTDFCEITHTGEGVDININKLQNTMLDFYLISYAEKVFAFSIYEHGTGFSKWISETYNIPYSCQFLH